MEEVHPHVENTLNNAGDPSIPTYEKESKSMLVGGINPSEIY